MAIFSVQIEDADVPRVLDALSASYGRRDTVPNPDFDPNQPEDLNLNLMEIANPESKAEFANRMVRRFLSEHVQAYEVKQAKAAALLNVSTDISISDPQV